MGLDDKISNKAQEIAGTIKEKVGEATDNERLAAEGEAERRAAGVKQSGEDLKDAGKRAKDALG